MDTQLPVVELVKAKVQQEKHVVLADVDLKISQGEFVYLVGRTGAGKTSLLKTLYADLKLKEGEGNVAGYALRKLKSSKIPYLRRKTGIIFQDFQLLTDRSVRDNLEFVMKATGWKNNMLIRKRVDELLNLVGLSHKKNSFPTELSGGEQQRVVIARALINEPFVLLADEPTGNLDPEVSEEILRLLQRIAEEGTAILMATHNYSLIQKYPNRIIRIRDGKLEEIKSTEL